MHLSPRAWASLVPNSESEDEFGKIGLLFSRDEFNEVVEWVHEYSLDHDLQDQIFLWTSRHAGVVGAIL
jgi:hypothetical protein